MSFLQKQESRIQKETKDWIPHQACPQLDWGCGMTDKVTIGKITGNFQVKGSIQIEAKQTGWVCDINIGKI